MKYDVSQHNAERVIHLPDSEIAGRYQRGETMAELATAYGVSTPTIVKALDREGVPRRKAARRPGRFSGKQNLQWKGGRRRRRDGYWLVWTPDGEQLEHRVIMAKHLGRALKDCEVIHHKDGNRSNNAVCNLEIMTASDHAKLHAPCRAAARYGHHPQARSMGRQPLGLRPHLHR